MNENLTNRSSKFHLGNILQTMSSVIDIDDKNKQRTEIIFTFLYSKEYAKIYEVTDF